MPERNTSADNATTCAEDQHPEEIVIPAGTPRSLFPPAGDLVFKRDRSIGGIVYSADIKDWFLSARKPSNGRNGNGRHGK